MKKKPKPKVWKNGQGFARRLSIKTGKKIGETVAVSHFIEKPERSQVVRITVANGQWIEVETRDFTLTNHHETIGASYIWPETRLTGEVSLSLSGMRIASGKGRKL